MVVKLEKTWGIETKGVNISVRQTTGIEKDESRPRRLEDSRLVMLGGVKTNNLKVGASATLRRNDQVALPLLWNILYCTQYTYRTTSSLISIAR